MRRSISALIVCFLWTSCQPDSPSHGGESFHGLVLASGPNESSGSGESLLIVNRFEVTRGEYLGSEVSSHTANFPAAGMTRDEAQAWAELQGGRLPSWEEWDHLAWTGDTRFLPGNTLDLGLGRALPVGVFESSRTMDGAYDFHGNVWEWLAEEPGMSGVCAGGSFASYQLVEPGLPHQRKLDANDRAEDVGFRWIADAQPFFRLQILPLWQQSEENCRETAGPILEKSLPHLRAALAVSLHQEQIYPEAFVAWVAGS
jgi:hypothetical protein